MRKDRNHLIKKSALRKWKTAGLEKLVENSPYRNRAEAIGNNDTIMWALEILHHRGEIDCQTAYCLTVDCPQPKNLYQE